MQGSRVATALPLTLVLLLTASLGYAAGSAEIVITGRVVSSAGAPLYGANVTVEAAQRSVGTNDSGMYTITLPARYRGSAVVVRARSFGYVPQVRTVALEADSIVVDFALVQDVNRLSQVVVTGMTGATATRKMPFTVSFAAATPNPMPAASTRSPDPGRDLSGEEYDRIIDNPFRSPRAEPLSTFGVDVDRASYSNIRRIITIDQQRPPADAVRIEELINYFTYDYAAPTAEHPFAVHADVASAPWAPEHLLVRIGLQARTIDLETAPANNLVFLLDVSGSMHSPDKLPLLKEAFRLLVAQLREQDRVAIVVYAGTEGLALPSTSGADKQAILGAIDRLEAGGSTAGGAGIRLAYDVAEAGFIPEGNNRVILATDGDFNVGTTSNAELERLVEARRAAGTALTVLGFGAGNIKDNRMEMLADKGNGNYAYIDSRKEAHKVFVKEMGGTLVTVAKDVKLQIEFNPAVVAGYRLIGYENRILDAEDFTDDRKDAGDMGAGHTVTAIYEVIPVGARDAERVRMPDSLRYAAPTSVRATADELLFVKLRYKSPKDSVSVPMDFAVPNRVTTASADFRFVQAVAAFGMSLRESEYRGTATPEMARRLASGALGRDEWGYRAEFVKLVSAYMALPEARVSVDRR